MPVDFFENQRAAKRKTFVLLIAYFLSILVIVPLVYLAVNLLSMGWHTISNWAREATHLRGTFTPIPHPGLWHPELFVRTTIVTALVVLGGSLWRVLLLSRGGTVVATMLGGKRVHHATRDRGERRALNVVEEMAIASGLPVPPLYVMTGASGINAFAAGLTPGTAVIAITGEALRILSRDELQAVVAHEFNHILTGDMQLKMWVLGILSGLSVVRQFWTYLHEEIGIFVVVIFFFLAPISIPLAIVSEAAILLAALVQGALSRQCEYRADAAAVQFTRDPTGLSDALKTVGGFVSRGRVTSAHEGQTNHFFVVNALGGGPGTIALFSSHPPLVNRIRRMDPEFTGEFEYVPSTAARQRKERIARSMKKTIDVTASMPMTPEHAMSQIGIPSPAHLAFAIALVEGMPAPFTESVRHPHTATSIVYALLLSEREDTRRKQLDILRERAPTDAEATVEILLQAKSQLKPEQAFPLAQLVTKSLRALSKTEFTAFSDTVKELVRVNDEVTLLEFGLQRMIRRRLAAALENKGRPPLKYREITPLIPTCGRLLSCLAYWGTYDVISQQDAFEKGMRKIDQQGAIDITPRQECRLGVLSEALDDLEMASLSIRHRVIKACVTCVLADNKATIQETQFLQIVADALECPMPPLLALPSAKRPE